MNGAIPTDAATPPPGGAAYDHPIPPILPLLLAPATRKEKNVHRMELVAVACWRLDDVRFRFGGSFVLPDTAAEFTELGKLCARHKDSPLSIFGHADPVGDEAVNKTLSTRRSEAVYSVLTRDVDRWERLYSSAGSEEDWGESAIRTMLAHLGYQPGTDAAPYSAAIRAFQDANDLRVDGRAGVDTRKKLFAAYMDAICPFALTKEQFLGKGADPNGRGDFQGCGSFNPVMLFSEAELAELMKAENRSKRDGENSVNRRVVVLLFRPGSEVPPDRWPCTQSLNGCRRRFWSDSAKRLSNGVARREFGSTGDTFGCRFYHRLTGESPCEGVAAGGFFDLQVIDDESGEPIAGVEFRVTLASGVVQDLASDAEGRVYVASAPPGVCRITSAFEDLPVTMNYDFVKLV